MSTVSTDVLHDTAIPTTHGTDASIALGRLALWAMLGAKLLGAWGLRWDIQWHVRIGRDSFWIAPHLMTYTGVTLVVLLSFGVLLRETLRHGWAPVAPPMLRRLGLVGTRGFHLAAWGIGLTVLAAPIDDLWHRLFGLDVTLWSPPHLLGIAGGVVNTLACLVIAREVYPAHRRGRLVATVIAAAMLYGSLQTVSLPTFLVAYVHGGVFFHAYAMLGALLFPLALIPAARLASLRAAPLVVVIVAALIGLSSEVIARVGFELLHPVSVIEEAIAKDPTSPVALTNIMARKTGERAGSSSPVLVLASLIPALVFVGLDARRRPLAASLGYAVTLFAIFGWILAFSPALGPMAPGSGATLIALVLTVVAALAGGAAGQRLALALQHD
jgi:hypothetical protein